MSFLILRASEILSKIVMLHVEYKGLGCMKSCSKARDMWSTRRNSLETGGWSCQEQRYLPTTRRHVTKNKPRMFLLPSHIPSALTWQRTTWTIAILSIQSQWRGAAFLPTIGPYLWNESMNTHSVSLGLSLGVLRSDDFLLSRKAHTIINA